MSADASASVPDPVPADAQESPVAHASPPQPPPPAKRPRRRPKWLLPVVGGVVAAALIAGLIVWQPWSPRPVAPKSLTAQSPNATSILLTWSAPTGGATPDQYVILRDGAQVAEIPGDQTSWTNTGLKPGDKFRYAVATRGGGWQSGPSPIATVTTLVPSPTGLSVTSTYTSATLSWQPSSLGPEPDAYAVYNGSSLETTLPGSTTSYVQGGQLAGAPYHYTVVSVWGNVRSAPSAVDSGAIRSAPLSELRDVTVTPTSIPSGATGSIVGRAFPTSWQFTPQCATSSCRMTVNLLVPGSTNQGFPMTVKVRPSGADYTGTAQVKFVKCMGTVTTDTVNLTLVPAKGQISNGAWGSWAGTMSVNAPYIDLDNGYYCNSGSWDFKVSSGGTGGSGSGSSGASSTV